MKLKHVDAIRGIAILMVMLVHVSQAVQELNPGLFAITSFGQMGVQLFFVASAYTLCLSASKRKNETYPLKKYAIRRFFRIAPVYYIGILVYFLIALADLWRKSGAIELPENYSFLNILSNIFFVHGFYPPGNNTVVPGGWSIGTEMAFYLIFPLLFYFVQKITSSHLKFVLLSTLLVIAFSQLILLARYSVTGILVSNNTFMYYNLITQLPVFCIGIGYFILEQNNLFQTNRKFDLTAFIILMAVSITLFTVQIPHLASIVPFISALAFVFLINIFKNTPALNFKLLTRIGTVSYSMYIIHFLFTHRVSYFISVKFGAHINQNIQLILFYAITVGGTFFLARLSEKYIEKPFIEMGRLLIKNRFK